MAFDGEFNKNAFQMTVPILGIGVKADFNSVKDRDALMTDIVAINRQLGNSIHKLRTDNDEVNEANAFITIGHHGMQVDFTDAQKPDSAPFETQYFGFGNFAESEMSRYQISPDAGVRDGFVKMIRANLELNMTLGNDGIAESAAGKIFDLWYRHEVLANPKADQTHFFPYGSNNIS